MYIIVNDKKIILEHAKTFFKRLKGFMGTRNINYSLCYGDIAPNIDADLSFNWWGKNDVSYDDNIILSLETDEYPPVIGSDLKVVGRMTGKNGKKYNIPPVKFLLSSNCEGYFQNPSGYILNQKIETTYVDAIKEGDIAVIDYAGFDGDRASFGDNRYAF